MVWYDDVIIIRKGKQIIMKLDFESHPEAQDMIKIIEKDKGLPAPDAIRFSINQDIYNEIVKASWASIALSMWGHDDPYRKWSRMDTPYVEVEIEENKKKLVNDIAKKEDVDIETAVCYFLLFTMDAMGYHI